MTPDAFAPGKPGGLNGHGLQASAAPEIISRSPDDWLTRQRALVGDEATERLRGSSVLIFGLGGVGGYAFEAVLRSGVGKITAVDHDRFTESNLNRQILALRSTIGRLKAEAAAERAAEINPAAEIRALPLFVTPENAARIISEAAPGFIIDAVDNITAKIAIIEAAKAAAVPAVSCMGTGNRLDPSRFRFCDISETGGCPLARVMRRELRARSLSGVEVLFSDEPPVSVGSRTPASISFVPAAAGLLLASRAAGYFMLK